MTTTMPDHLSSHLAKHDARLQSLRGLAALSVLFGHAALILSPTSFTLMLSAIFQATPAVVFFYVLSGYVLGQSLRRDGRFGPFARRRLARLLPVLWVSILLGAVVGAIMRGANFPGVSGWFDIFLNIETGPWDIFTNLFSLSTSINGSMWSIQVELAMIPVLPILAPVLMRAPILGVLVGAAVLCALSDGLFLQLGASFPYLRAITYSYLYSFYFGLIIPRIVELRSLRSLMQSGAAIIVELAALIVIYSLVERDLFSAATMQVLDAVVSAHIICYVSCSPRNATWLLHKWLVGLGDISYSFYAYGQVLLVACAALLFCVLPTGWGPAHPAIFTLSSALLALAVLLPVASLSFRFIELPSIAVGRFDIRRLGTGLTAKSERVVVNGHLRRDDQ